MPVVVLSDQGKKQCSAVVLQGTAVDGNVVNRTRFIVPEPFGVNDWDDILDGYTQNLFGIVFVFGMVVFFFFRLFFHGVKVGGTA